MVSGQRQHDHLVDVMSRFDIHMYYIHTRFQTAARGRKLMTRSALTDQPGEARLAGRRSGPPPGEHGSGGGPERVTVNLVPRASRALQRLVDLTGDSKTDSINRAIQVCAYLEEISANGGDIYVREDKDKDSELRIVKMF